MASSGSWTTSINSREYLGRLLVNSSSRDPPKLDRFTTRFEPPKRSAVETQAMKRKMGDLRRKCYLWIWIRDLKFSLQNKVFPPRAPGEFPPWWIWAEILVVLEWWVTTIREGLIVFLFGRQGGGGICFNYFRPGPSWTRFPGLVKFYSLGWYVFCVALYGRRGPTISLNREVPSLSNHLYRSCSKSAHVTYVSILSRLARVLQIDVHLESLESQVDLTKLADIIGSKAKAKSSTQRWKRTQAVIYLTWYAMTTSWVRIVEDPPKKDLTVVKYEMQEIYHYRMHYMGVWDPLRTKSLTSVRKTWDYCYC